MRALVITIGVLATLGCGARPEVVAGTTAHANEWQHASAGFVGCRAADITISEHGEDNYVRSWIASCHGRDYVCSQVWDASGSCTPLSEGQSTTSPPSPPPP